MERQRADLLLVSRGLIATRAKARQAIKAGLVRSGEKIIQKASELLETDCPLTAELAYHWVSRAGLKLVAALDKFDVMVSDRYCLDLGASTGGFTQVLLSRGVAHVVSVDVGRDQLDAKLRDNQKITLLEGTDARTLSQDDLGVPLPDLVVMDVSFIGLEKILPHILPLVAPNADLIALVKPQFQAGPSRVGKRGIVDPDVAAVIAEEVRLELDGLCGFQVLSMMESPIAGGDGNREYLLHARRGDLSKVQGQDTP
ncbi:TlyA family RNA methyltransferase [Candidatus Phycosocius spiralis]|uniref:TlyA family rRNA (Cytidine-2'-O)-methyltransferase n=1 Tax=Candidatus Phycosocius spiralis TaxID=2815099 RepID=A0ABQ4PVF4_9PROT|nr:TlyA family RNA methyltransferase [Candidatus Phycosocius spiralis]GIU66946.1 TlyA family rRNA (cytidine-2'-O)-methyltransferase [Candidatus Phycosocius spiralis]